MFWYLERTLTFTCHLQNGSAFAFLHLLNTILGLWIFNAYSRYFVTECEWFRFCSWTGRVLACVHHGSISCALIQETYLICGIGLRHLLEWLVWFFFFSPLFIPFDWTFEILSMCLLFCFVCVDVVFVMLCVKINKKLLITKKNSDFGREKAYNVIHTGRQRWKVLMLISKLVENE